MVELDLFKDISMDIKQEILEKYPDHYMQIMFMFRAYKAGAFKVEDKKIIRTDPPPPPLPTDDKKTLRFRESLQQYERFKLKASKCKCPKGTHQQVKGEKATADELG